MSSAISIEPRTTRAPAGLLEPRLRVRVRTRWWVEALVIAWLCWLYDATTNFAPLRLHTALANARGILDAERALHIDPELALDRWLNGHRALAVILSNYYDNAHFVVTLGLLGWLWWRRADLYRPLRNVLVLVNLLGLLVFWRYPVAPPRMLTSYGFSDVVANTHAFGSWHSGSLASHANQLAAMPSLHMAWAAWCALALWRITANRFMRGLALLYPCVTAVTVLATGNHFLLDVVAGLAVTALAVLAVSFQGRLRVRLRAASLPKLSRAPLVGRGARPAYPMSQTCYEVRDQVE